MEKKFSLRVGVSMPDEIILEMPSIYHGDRGVSCNQWKTIPALPVEALSKEEAELYGEEIKQAFIKHWETKVEAAGNPGPVARSMLAP